MSWVGYWPLIAQLTQTGFEDLDEYSQQITQINTEPGFMSRVETDYSFSIRKR